MDIKTIGVEEWLNVWEKSATWDIAQSTISSLTMGELRALDEQDGATFYERLDRDLRYRAVHDRLYDDGGDPAAGRPGGRHLL